MNIIFELMRPPAPGKLLLEWHQNGDLANWLPEVDRLFGVPQNPNHHPEVDTGVHIAMCLDMANRLNASEAARFAVLVHDLGKGLTPAEELPMHVDHEFRGLDPVREVCDRLGVPSYWKKLALLVCEYHLHAHRAFEMRSKSMLKLLSTTGLETNAQLLNDFVTACEADKRGRRGKTETPYLQGQYIRQAAAALQGLYMAPGTPIDSKEAHALYEARLQAVRNAGKPFRVELARLKTAAIEGC